MADFLTRKLISEPEFDSLVTAFNALRDDYFLTLQSAVIHRDDNVLDVTTATAVDLATSIALANALKAAYNGHIAKTDAHKAADAANVTTSADATDLASTQTLLNEIKTDFNAHIVSTTFHANSGAADNVATANATDQTTSNALANALKTAFNAHHARKMSSSKIVRGAP
jgi:hypothetical protein